MALDIGIDERQVRVTELQMQQLSEIMRRVFSDDRLRLTDDQRKAVPMVARDHLARAQ